ncbi:arrestin domain containing protein [Aspergillus flavus]|nr:arrestin domain containing protein [Aspergillus flavus]
MVKLFKNSSPRKIQPTYFDIRLDHNTIWIPAAGHTIKYGHAQGKVILCLSDPTCVRDVKLHLEGRYYINWDTTFPTDSHRHCKAFWKELPFHHDVWSFLRVSAGSSATTLEPGNYEFPFQMCLPGRLPESMRGIDDCYIHYFLRAQIYGRKGESVSTSREVTVRKVYNTPSRTAPSSVENDWPDKIMYKVSIATPTVQFGGNIRVTYRFVPLLKGLTVKSIRSGVIETHTVLRPYASRSREVLTDAFDPPTWEEMDISTDDRCWYQCSRMLHLPKSTRQCLQSVATTVLKVGHSIQFSITLLNPDGHLSSIRLSLPIVIIFYPSTSASLQMLSDIATWDEEENTLPHYSDHVRDLKLVEICPGNPSTPAGPGSNEKPPDYSVSHDVSDIPSYWDTI